MAKQHYSPDAQSTEDKSPDVQAVRLAGLCPRMPDAGTSASVPGTVIPGESYPLPEGFPESGESYTLTSRQGYAQLVSHPIPHPEVPGYAALTDFLNVTFPFPDQKKGLTALMTRLFEVLGNKFSPAKDRGRGFNGYTDSIDLGPFGAKFAYGGQRGTALLFMPGLACAAVPDWQTLRTLLEHELQARITRWDGAIDDMDGIHPLDEAVGLYKAGYFTNGGNKPSCRQAGNWVEPDGTGRTFYIGKRQNGKMLRIYEKGMQCIHAWHPWVRYELELHNVDRVIPWDVLDKPGPFVAGAFPKALGWVHEEASRIRTIQKEGQLSYGHLVECASHTYGRLINVMLEVEGSPEQVLEKLRKAGSPSRLKFPSDWK